MSRDALSRRARLPRFGLSGGGTLASMSGGHDHGAVRLGVSWRVRRVLTGIVLVLALATLVGVLVLWPNRDVSRLGEKLGLSNAVYGATVVHETRGPCSGDATAARSTCQEVRVRLEQGPDRGKVKSLSSPTRHRRRSCRPVTGSC